MDQRRVSDNLISVKEISATEAARQFSDVLDAVEHRGESFSIVRRGHAVAHLVPAAAASGKEVKDFLLSHRADASWRSELADLRAGSTVEERSWTD